MNEIDAKTLKISERAAKLLAKLNINNLFDLILHLPLRYEDETHITPLADVRIGDTVLIEAEVDTQQIMFRPRRQLVVKVSDEMNHTLFLRFIHFYPSHQKALAEGKTVRVVGEVRQGFYGFEMVHPKILSTSNNQELSETLTPVYPTTSGLNQNNLRRIIQKALEKAELSDTLPQSLLDKLHLPSFDVAIRQLHFPTPDNSLNDLNNRHTASWVRLKFDELLAQQLSMKLARDKRQLEQATPLRATGVLYQQLISSLPFSLTVAQQKCLDEIQYDLSQSHPMHRLLQGDVGSGKTIVAAFSALTALEAGFQAALMAPTEILAEQHYQKFRQWFEPLNIRIAHLSGSLKKKEKDNIKEALSRGEIQFIVGTHALFQKDVEFKQLGLVIVDEQHRFGVHQRLSLKNKGQSVHQLMMSATPIPRTLAMGFFADLDISVIDQLPPGRTPIKTRLINNSRRCEVEQYVHKIINQGRQVYWVCPLIEESEILQLQTATETFERLSQTFSDLSVGLVHGRMKPNEKSEVMEKFVSGSLNILVATTVIEVGVDVPNATLMIIEHAERMGLSQLHQLRGRVGRGSHESICILLFGDNLTEIAKARLKIIYENTDGFEIARQDLQLRGPGEFLGAKQSGIPMLRFADLQKDISLLEQARNVAQELISQNNECVTLHLNRWLAHRDEYLGA